MACVSRAITSLMEAMVLLVAAFAVVIEAMSVVRAVIAGVTEVTHMIINFFSIAAELLNNFKEINCRDGLREYFIL
jgi:hypothetical protein